MKNELSGMYRGLNTIKFATLGALAGLILFTSSCGGVKVSKGVHHYPEYYVNTYMTFCVRFTGDEKKVSASVAENYCDCLLRESEKRYSFDEYSQLDKHNPEDRRVIETIKATCSRFLE